MATASSAKSTSSVAALLLVLAIVAGTCASGAYADVPIELDPITCAVDVNVTIYLNGAYPLDGVALPAEDVNLSNLVNPLYIKIADEVYQVAGTDLSNLLSVTGLVKLVVACKSTTPNAITIAAYVNVLGIPVAIVVVIANLVV